MPKKKGKTGISVFIIAVGILSITAALLFFLKQRNENVSVSGSMPAGNDFIADLNEPHRKEKSDIYLYFSDAGNNFLIAEKRALFHSSDPAEFGTQIVNELIKGPRNSQQNGVARTIPEKTVLNALYVANDGTAYVDFSEEIKENYPGGSNSEYLTIYSIVNSIVYNVPDVRKVKILIKGNEALTLAGHIGLQSTFEADMVLVR